MMFVLKSLYGTQLCRLRKRPHWYVLFFDIFVLGPWLGLVMYLHLSVV